MMTSLILVCTLTQWKRDLNLMLMTPTGLGIIFSAANFVLANSTTFIYSENGANLAISFTVAADSGDLAFCLSAQADHDWVGFGIGTHMKDSLMFIAYRTKNGTGKKSDTGGCKSC
jgi:hypothetical protein